MVVPNIELVVKGATHCHANEITQKHWQDEQLRLDVQPGIHLDQVIVT